MSISLRRVRAIFVKDYKEFSRNYAISIILIIPIMFAFLFRAAGSSLPGAVGFLLNTSFVLVTTLAQACLIAEEKERNTLRSLMMTPATTMDVLIGKSSLVFAMSAVVLAIALYLYGYQPAIVWAFVPVMILSIILYTAVGTICGLFSRTLLEASLIVTPVAVIFAGAPWGASLEEKYPIFKILDYAPSSQLVHFLGLSSTGFTTDQLLKPLLITVGWTIVLTVISVILYQRRLKDE